MNDRMSRMFLDELRQPWVGRLARRLDLNVDDHVGELWLLLRRRYPATVREPMFWLRSNLKHGLQSIARTERRFTMWQGGRDDQD